MSSLSQAYAKVRNGIVAFAAKYEPVIEGQQPSPLPTIFGTGFVVDPSGIIATNDHVIRAIAELPGPPEAAAELRATAWLNILTPSGNLQIPMDVKGVWILQKVHRAPGAVHYGPPKPDIGFVHVNMTDLYPLTVDGDTELQEGESIATAGFPMGESLLIGESEGVLRPNQFGPTLQAGIVSAVHPFPSKGAHGFTINVMAQGGASGSPIFRPTDGAVVGIVYSRINEPDYDERGNLKRIAPTNFTYAVPAHYIKRSLEALRKDPKFAAGAPGSVSIKQRWRETPMINMITGQASERPPFPWD